MMMIGTADGQDWFHDEVLESLLLRMVDPPGYYSIAVSAYIPAVRGGVFAVSLD
jgi:hypothetical protein